MQSQLPVQDKKIYIIITPEVGVNIPHILEEVQNGHYQAYEDFMQKSTQSVNFALEQALQHAQGQAGESYIFSDYKKASLAQGLWEEQTKQIKKDYEIKKVYAIITATIPSQAIVAFLQGTVNDKKLGSIYVRPGTNPVITKVELKIDESHDIDKSALKQAENGRLVSKTEHGWELQVNEINMVVENAKRRPQFK